MPVLTYYDCGNRHKSMKLYIGKGTDCCQEIQWHSYGRGQMGHTPKILVIPTLPPLFTC